MLFRNVLKSLKQASLTVKHVKCSFGHTHVSYLRHAVESQSTRKTKIDAIETRDKPQTKTDVRLLLSTGVGLYN